MSAAKAAIIPQLQVQSRLNGLVVALPNHSNIGGLAKHFNSKGDNELVFAEVKTTGRRRSAETPMRIGSMEKGAESKPAARGKKASAAPAADDLA